MLVLGIDGSPTGGGRTAAALRAVLRGAADHGAQTALATLAEDGLDQVLARAHEAAAFAIGSPVHRASYAAPLKELLDALPRGMWGEATAPLTGRAVAMVATGATWHHFLALDDLRNVLGGFFAAHVVPPGLYVPAAGFDDALDLLPPFGPQAGAQGAALVELARALETFPALAAPRPQA